MILCCDGPYNGDYVDLNPSEGEVIEFENGSVYECVRQHTDELMLVHVQYEDDDAV